MANPRAVCPICGSTIVQGLIMASALADVDYYMCDQCRNVWSVPKGKDGPITHITNHRRR